MASSGFIPLGHRGLIFSGWIECPKLQGCLGPWVHLSTWCIWVSPATATSFPSHSRGPILCECCSRTWTCLSLRAVPQDTQDGGWPTMPRVNVWGCLLCWVWIRNLSPRLSCQESLCAMHDELQCSQFKSTELQWVTNSAITPTGDNQCRALLV